MLYALIFWVIVGLIAGALTKAVMPGGNPGGIAVLCWTEKRGMDRFDQDYSIAINMPESCLKIGSVEAQSSRLT